MTADKVRAGRLRPARISFFLAAAIAVAGVPAHAQEQPLEAVKAAIQSAGKSDSAVRAFYQARGNRPLWVQGGALGPEAETFLDIVARADLDGLDPDSYRPRSLASAIRKAEGGSPKALAKAEMLLSQTFAAYVRDVRAPRQIGMVYADPAVAPVTPSTRAILQAAASAPSLQQYLENSAWAHPIYGQLRRALAQQSQDGASEQLLRLNLDRARALPADAGQRYVLVDAAAARLFMYENGRVVDSMKVVVGKASEQTPMIAGMIRLAMVNPYWNVPPDLVQARIAPNVLSQGQPYLRTKRYQLLSDWSDKAEVLDPKSVDWQSVADGSTELRVRQLPGGDNAMGKMKFMFPNDMGIYLHDTPDKNLFAKADRQFSSGCVRLEDAPRLAQWLFGKPLKVRSKTPEQKVELADPVPVYITYLTAAPEGQRIAFRQDVYNRDGAQLALAGSRARARR